MKSNEKIRYVLEDLCYVPEATLSPNNLVLQNMDTSFFLITNRSTEDKAIYKINCQGISIVKNDGHALLPSLTLPHPKPNPHSHMP